ncbi:MAG TPA: hypothetical protein VGQ55_11080, partial [Pyrinomonadaceae bacterium]|nr:hypothetical protein [Pyrinomonadaceae bacterium]
MRERISKAKAYIAVRNYNAAIYELENIRRETSDQSVNAVTNVLLMNSYLEMGDYKRAQDFLASFYKSYKSNSANGNFYYSSVAAQVVKGARNQVERYRALGLTVSDRNLPLEAVNDIERMRETLEQVITQAKDLSTDKTKSASALALLEEATNSRSMIARDDYDAKRWRDEVADSREQIQSSSSVVINAMDGTTVPNAPQPQVVAANNPPVISTPAPQQLSASNDQTSPVFKPVLEQKPKVDSNATTSQPKPNENLVASLERPAVSGPAIVEEKREPKKDRVTEQRPTPTLEIKNDAPAAPAATATKGTLDVGSLIAYATKQAAPTYPPAA